MIALRAGLLIAALWIASAAAQIGSLPGMGPLPLATGKSITYQTSVGQATSCTTVNFTSVPIAGQYVIVGVSASNATAAISSVSVGGNAATLISDGTHNAGGTVTNGSIGLYIAATPAGSTATITVTFASATAQGCGIGVWTATGLTSTTAAYAGVTNFSSSSSAIILSTTTTGGFIVGIAGGNAYLIEPWVFTNLTADYTSLITGTTRYMGGGHKSNTASGGLTVNATTTANTGNDCNNCGFAAAAF